MRKHIEDLVEKSYRKYGLKESARKVIVDAIEVNYSTAKDQLTTEDEVNQYIDNQVLLYEIAAKTAQKEALARQSVQEPTPNPNPHGIDMDRIEQLISDKLSSIEGRMSDFQSQRKKDEVFSQIQSRLKEESGGKIEEKWASKAFAYVTKGVDINSINVEALYQEYKTEYQDNCSQAGVVAFKPGDPNGANTNPVDLTATNDWLKNQGLL